MVDHILRIVETLIVGAILLGLAFYVNQLDKKIAIALNHHQPVSRLYVKRFTAHTLITLLVIIDLVISICLS